MCWGVAAAGPAGGAVLARGQGPLKGRGRLFSARAFYATLALQAQGDAPIAISQVGPLSSLGYPDRAHRGPSGRATL